MFQHAHLATPKAGWIYANLLTDARALTHLSSNPSHTTYGLWWWIAKSQTGYDPVLWAFGGHEFNSGRTRLTLNSGPSQAGLQWLWDTMYKWKVMPTPPLMKSGFTFTSGKIGMAEIHNAVIATFRKQIGKRFAWGIAPMPVGPGKTGTSRTFVHTIGLSKGSRHPRSAFKLLTFLVGRYSEDALASEGSLPALKSAVRIYVKQSGPPSGMNTFLQSVSGARLAAMFNHDHSIEQIVNTELSLVWLNMVSPAATAAKITPEVDARLAKAVGGGAGG